MSYCCVLYVAYTAPIRPTVLPGPLWVHIILSYSSIGFIGKTLIGSLLLCNSVTVVARYIQHSLEYRYGFCVLIFVVCGIFGTSVNK